MKIMIPSEDYIIRWVSEMYFGTSECILLGNGYVTTCCELFLGFIPVFLLRFFHIQCCTSIYDVIYASVFCKISPNPQNVIYASAKIFRRLRRRIFQYSYKLNTLRLFIIFWNARSCIRTTFLQKCMQKTSIFYMKSRCLL